MSIKIIRHRERKESVHYTLKFEWRDRPGMGFSFLCDRDGNVPPFEFPETQANYDRCTSGEYDVVRKGVREHQYSWVEPAVGLCHCGNEVELPDGLDNECESCGAWYNSGGQSVVPSHLCDDQGDPYDY